MVKVGSVTFGNNGFVVIAGPCAVESEEQALTIAQSVKRSGAEIFRGGAFKPRTSPYSFQGLGKDGLKILAKVRNKTGLPIVTEAMDSENFKLVEEYADLVQIGARNMRNISLLKRAGRSGRPVLLKRAMSATLQEWLLAAEYIMEKGNSNIILCERGIRTFVSHCRNTLDLSVITAAKKETHLPVIADPSHASGARDMVAPLAFAATAGGADGLMIEVHHDPSLALSDGPQSLYPGQFEQCMKTIGDIQTCVRKRGFPDADK
jgi:3-deoxy-7-phosphoheptulonate synthase